MNSKPKITAIIISAIVATCIVASSVQAQPSDEIRRAVAAAGAPSVSAAPPDVFLHAFSSVVVRARGNVPAYVAAAISTRSDLAPQITAAALRAYRPSGKKGGEQVVSCDWVDPIIRAAIAAKPMRLFERRSMPSLTRGSVSSQPLECPIRTLGSRTPSGLTARRLLVVKRR